MESSFHVSRSFELPSRNYVVYAGKILEGTVRPGMLLCIGLNNSTNVSCPIHAVEYIDGPGPMSEVALCIRIDVAEDRSFWLGLNVSDEVVRIVDASQEDQH